MLCSSGWWARKVKTKLVPWGVAGVDLAGEVLEVGPGFGATTRELAPLAGTLTVVEQDEGYCRRLRSTFDGNVTVVHGDGTALPFEEAASRRRCASRCSTTCPRASSRTACSEK
jgi:16S rRNA A1518/A1519 N6-dimethyltransferase RsmA/KsgA/DIM1 with predicted DNA glycosylase/AP lyase activity